MHYFWHIRSPLCVSGQLHRVEKSQTVSSVCFLDVRSLWLPEWMRNSAGLEPRGLLIQDTGLLRCERPLRALPVGLTIAKRVPDIQESDHLRNEQEQIQRNQKSF